ncbi:LOW QUALITY PROTEIN: hypothetical protein TorRG33x02_001830 [Trema orientale]|uniref:Uncharacterized protein n=1 Tax=Trema orientale TaxID=63057 RepID=A0A2P5G1I2_TREOI|nr:LOW QUALITY PROTEIN: hypothetical protein TorRG33x02_001830 [Trema orientale]
MHQFHSQLITCNFLSLMDKSSCIYLLSFSFLAVEHLIDKHFNFNNENINIILQSSKSEAWIHLKGWHLYLIVSLVYEDMIGLYIMQETTTEHYQNTYH